MWSPAALCAFKREQEHLNSCACPRVSRPRPHQQPLFLAPLQNLVRHSGHAQSAVPRNPGLGPAHLGRCGCRLGPCGPSSRCIHLCLCFAGQRNSPVLVRVYPRDLVVSISVLSSFIRAVSLKHISCFQCLKVMRCGRACREAPTNFASSTSRSERVCRCCVISSHTHARTSLHLGLLPTWPSSLDCAAHSFSVGGVYLTALCLCVVPRRLPLFLCLRCDVPPAICLLHLY